MTTCAQPDHAPGAALQASRGRNGQRQPGLTLIELMVVLVIIGILAGIALPSYFEFVTRARIIDGTIKLGDFRLKMEKYFMDNRSYLNGADCGVPNPPATTADYFTISCGPPAPTATTYTILATGIAARGMSGFVYTVDQTNAKASSGPAGLVARSRLLGAAQGWTMLMRACPSPQNGSFMLESLVAVLIVALGLLGIVGLSARSIQNVDSSNHHSEAALLAFSLVGQMWVSGASLPTLQANFDSVGPGSGTGYVEFRNLVMQRLPNSLDPEVLVTAGPTANSSDVHITIKWTHPGDTSDPLSPKPRQYHLNATIGSNL